MKAKLKVSEKSQSKTANLQHVRGKPAILKQKKSRESLNVSQTVMKICAKMRFTSGILTSVYTIIPSHTTTFVHFSNQVLSALSVMFKAYI